MITDDDCNAIERGKTHCFIGHAEGGFRFICEKCKGEDVIAAPLPLWAMEGLSWGFCKEHADCGGEGEKV
jgi:hypothetical protein